MCKQQQRETIGWREWLALPDIGIPGVDTKIETGTAESILHTSFVEYFRRGGVLWARFGVTPLPQSEDIRLVCLAAVKDQRTSHDATGAHDLLPVIESLVQAGQHQFPTELLLVPNGEENFTLHLGRKALQNTQLLVDPKRSYMLGEPRKVSCDRTP